MDTHDRRLEELLARRKKLDQQIERIRSAVAREKRRLDTRRKILVGAKRLEEKRRREGGWAELVAEMDGYLTRDQDRALFELAPLEPECERATPPKAGKALARGANSAKPSPEEARP